MKDERQERLLLLAALLFAVRVFRGPDRDYHPPEYAQQHREANADRAALDAAAIMAAVAKLP